MVIFKIVFLVTLGFCLMIMLIDGKLATMFLFGVFRLPQFEIYLSCCL